MNKSSFLKKQIVKEAIRSVRKDKKVDEISLLNISRELGVEFSEVTRFYTSIEDIFLQQQKSNWKKVYRNLDNSIKKAKTPGDFKSVFDKFLESYVEGLSPDADLHWEVSSFMPVCLAFREENKQVLFKKMHEIIRRGWPGKTPNVLERQTNLFLLSFFGFIDHIVHQPKTERIKILKDFRNMLNLHLQDRLFF